MGYLDSTGTFMVQAERKVTQGRGIFDQGAESRLLSRGVENG